MPPKKFTGSLADHIPKGLTDDGTDDARIEKLDLLLEHYGLENAPPDVQIAFLAWRLACDFVPGFQVEARGRKDREKPEKDYKAFLAIREELEAGADNLKDACQRASAKTSIRQWGYKTGTLENIYRRIENMTGGIASLIEKPPRSGRHKR